MFLTVHPKLEKNEWAQWKQKERTTRWTYGALRNTECKNGHWKIPWTI